MRDLLLLVALLVPMALALRRPWIGVLGWTWVSLMNPHSYSWHLSTMPVAAAMGGATLLGVFFTREKRNFVVSREAGVLLIFMLWMTITLPFSYGYEQSWPLWVRVMKIDFMTLVAMVVLYSRKHIFALAWVLVVSIGIYGVKGGLFTLATGGSYRVWGPEGSYIEGNNEVALALILIIPLMRFLKLQTGSIWIQRSLTAAMVLCAIAALGSQSRGALIAIIAMTAMMWWRGKRKLLMGLIFAALAISLLAFMPEDWSQRMATIKTYEQDDSAMQRINAWWMAWNIAKDNIFGAGFMVSLPAVCSLYSPIPDDCRAAHSIYFMVLGEHGFVGLFLFILLWASVWWSAGQLRVQGKRRPDTQWVSDLGAMSQVSLAGYAVGGAFLSLSYYDLPYNILILVVLARRWMATQSWLTEVAAQNVAPADSNKLSLS